MGTAIVQHMRDARSTLILGQAERRTTASYERELSSRKSTEAQLRKELAQDEARLDEKDALIEHLKVLGKESDHRMLNGLQLVASLISMQGRSSANADTASQLAVAADRVITIERIHRRLHCLDGLLTVAFKQYLDDLCRDFSAMLSSNEHPERVIVVEAHEIDLPAATAIPLGFIVNELLTNAVKYGKGRITVRLEGDPPRGYALSVFNEGPSVPVGFDPAAGKGLGMKIIRSFVGQIGGELQIGRGTTNEGSSFTVLFS